MSYKDLLYDKKKKIVTITLNRPEKLNAMGVAMQKDLVAAFQEAGADNDVNVIILKGAGRAFSAGWDMDPNVPDPIAPAAAFDVWKDVEILRDKIDRLLAIRDVPKPIIAQIHGYCLAGASQIAAVCDIAIVAEDTIIGPSTQAPMGAGYAAPMWIWLIGARKFREIRYQVGLTMSGKEADRIGWANKAVPADKLEATVNELAAKIAETPLDLLKFEKLLINRVEDIMGYRTIAMLGCDIDTMARLTPGPQAFYKLTQQKGLKEALRGWRELIS